MCPPATLPPSSALFTVLGAVGILIGVERLTNINRDYDITFSGNWDDAMDYFDNLMGFDDYSIVWSGPSSEFLADIDNMFSAEEDDIPTAKSTKKFDRALRKLRKNASLRLKVRKFMQRAMVDPFGEDTGHERIRPNAPIYDAISRIEQELDCAIPHNNVFLKRFENQSILFYYAITPNSNNTEQWKGSDSPSIIFLMCGNHTEVYGAEEFI